MTADMSVAPEIARLAEPVLPIPPQPATSPPNTDTGSGSPATPGAPQAPACSPTLGTLARQLRMLAVTPERWWSLLRFDPDRPVKIGLEQHPWYRAWLVILPPGDTGQDCDCDVATIIAGEVTEGDPASAILQPGPIRVHGPRHRLRGHGAGYSVSLHVRAKRAYRRATREDQSEVPI
jgi:hypothetical protein